MKDRLICLLQGPVYFLLALICFIATIIYMFLATPGIVLWILIGKNYPFYWAASAFEKCGEYALKLENWFRLDP